MNYTKQNFMNGQTLNAEHLNHIEDGIRQLSKEIANVGNPTDEQVETAVNEWLDAHPEVTTTVEDGAVTLRKLDDGVVDLLSQPIRKKDSGDGVLLYDISPLTHRMRVTVKCPGSVDPTTVKVFATSAANIIPFPYPMFTTGATLDSNGVTATVQNDGGILLNGTPTSETYIKLCNIKWSDVSFNSNPGVSSNPNFKTSYVPRRWEVAYDKSNGNTFITLKTGATFTNEVVYPVITSVNYPDGMAFSTGVTPNESVADGDGNLLLKSVPDECFVFADKSGVEVEVEYTVDYNELLESSKKKFDLIVEQPSETQVPDNVGFYTISGTLRTDLAEAYHTNLILLTDYNHIEAVARLYNKGYILAFFDKNKKIIHDISVIGEDPAKDHFIDMAIPEGAVYCSLSHYNSAGASQPYIKLSFKVGEDTILSSLKGKVINVLGDSITSVDYTTPNWWQKIAERTGARFNNYGVSGTSIAVRSGRTDSFLERADNLDLNADALFIMGGTNDSNALIGEWNSTDTTTFFGALNALFTKVCEKFTGKPIIVATPIQSTATYPSIQFDAVALVEKVLNEYKADPTKQSAWWILQTRAECIRLKCRQYGLPCLDLFYTSGINGADSGKIYFRPNDTLHPSAYGQERLAVLIQTELEKYFKLNLK